MKHDGVKYEFAPKELFYFLFDKKKCPNCGAKMNKRKEFEILTGAECNGSTDPVFIAHGKVKRYMYFFDCQECGSAYTLQELAK